MFKDFAVKGAIRELLQKPIGKIITAKQLFELSPENLICVGDAVSETALKLSLSPLLIIFDKKEKRRQISEQREKLLKKYGALSFKCRNPAGVLSLEAWKTVYDALSANTPARIEVDGEEDLLALAVLLLAPSGYNLIYGQPDKGIVLVEITDKLKQKYILELCADLGKTFLQNIKGTTVIVHDSDTDGCTSAAIFTKFLQKKKIKAVPMVTRDAIIHENVQRQIAKLKPANLIVLDLGGEAHEYIRNRSRHMQVMVVDHHRMPAALDFGRAHIVNPHIFKIPEQLNPPTAYLSFLICNTLDWVSALGVVADKGHASCPSFLRQMKTKYKADFERIKDYTNAADVMRDSEYIISAVLKAKKPQDLAKNKKLIAYEKEFSAEVSRLVGGHKAKTQFFHDIKLLIYDIETKYSLRGGISNQLQQLYPGWTIIIGEKQGSHYAMSMRTSNNSVDLVQAIKASIANLEDAAGGGHAKASGCKVLYEDKDKFLKSFMRAIR